MIQAAAQTFRADKTPADVDARMIAARWTEVGSEMSAAHNVKTAEMYAAGSDTQVVGVVRRRTTNTAIHSTYTLTTNIIPTDNLTTTQSK